LKNKHKIAILISGLCFLIISISAGVLFNKYYLSNIILSGPFSVSIKKNSGNYSQIKIYGYSPIGLLQVLSQKNNSNMWCYNGDGNFCNLYFFIEDSVVNFSDINIITSEKTLRLHNVQLPPRLSYDISKKLKCATSKKNIVMNMLQWKETKLSGIAVLGLSGIFLTMWMGFRKSKKTSRLYKVICFIFVPFTLLHVFFTIYSGYFLVTSGLLVLVAVLLLTNAVILLLITAGLKKKTMQNFQLIISSILGLMFLLELIFLVTGYKSTSMEKRFKIFYISPYSTKNKSIYHTWKSNHKLKDTEFCYYRPINTENLSDEEHPLRKSKNEYRIIGLGDSFTEGDGADADSTWLKFLERNHSKYAVSKQLTYFNGGVCGSDPIYSYMLFKDKLLKYKPDLVILTINTSDLTDIFIRGGMDRFQTDCSVRFRKPPWWEPIYAMSRISRLFFSALGYNELLYKESETDFKKEKNIIIENIRAYIKLGAQNNFKFLLVFHPFKGEIESGQMGLSDIYYQLEQTNKVELLNLLDYFVEGEKINSSNCGQYFWKNDGHHNAKGYELFARGIEWKLKEMGIIDSLLKNTTTDF